MKLAIVLDAATKLNFVSPVSMSLLKSLESYIKQSWVVVRNVIIIWVWRKVKYLFMKMRRSNIVKMAFA